MRNQKIFLKDKKNYLNPLNNKRLQQIFEGENILAAITQSKDIRLTALEEDFLKKIEQFIWDEYEKELFIKETLASTPKERNKLLEEMNRTQV